MIGDLAPAEIVEITFTATPAANAPLNVTNWASVETFTALGAPLPTSVSGARDDDPATAAMGDFGLEISKTPDEQQYGYLPGTGEITWDLTISNPSTLTTNTDLVVTDFLPAPLTFDSWSSTDLRVSEGTIGATGAGVGGTTEISWDISDLGPGESVTIELIAASSGTETAMAWYVNDVQVVSDEIVDEVVNQAKVRFYEAASLGDYVWFDDNADGMQDSSESGVDGATVNLLDAAGNQLYRNPTTGAITTDPALGYPAMSVITGDDPSTPGVESGWYEFDDLPPGIYIVEFVPPTGYLLTFDDRGSDDASDSDADRLTGLSAPVTLDPGENDPTIDAGLVPADGNSIGDFVWIDDNQDGVQDGGELPLEGIIVELIDPATGAVLATTTTDASGFYEFVNLPDGEYIVDFALDPAVPGHADLVPTWENQGSDDGADSDANRGTGKSDVIDLDAAGLDSDPVRDETIDAGFFSDPGAINEIGDFVWFDTNGDGIQDIGEPPVEGVVVELIDPITGNVIATTTTDASGFYEFTDLPDGQYQVQFVPPAGNDLTWPNQGSDDGTDSDADRVTGLTSIIDLDSAGVNDNPVIDNSVDAGLIPDANNEIGDFVWIDDNQDGVQDGGELLLVGVIVELVDPVTGIVLDATTTDASGFYQFTDLPDGEYIVDFALDPANPAHATLVPTWEDQGSDDGADSDSNRETGESPTISLDPDGTNADPVVDDTIDAGFFSDPGAVNEIGDFVWIDDNQDGVQDGGELPLEGIIVELIDPATGNVIATTTTDASGFYEFTNLPDGEYQIQFTPDPMDPIHAGLVPTFENSGDDAGTDSNADRSGLTAIISLDPDGTDGDPVVDDTIDAGFFPDPGAINEIGDFVWIDDNQDGVQDGGELPLEGVIVELIDPATGNVIATTTTDASGFYEFVNLPDGEYIVDFALDPANPAHTDLVPTWEDQGSDDGLDSDANRETGWSSVIVLDPGSVDDNPVVDATVDAGFFSDPGAVNEIGDFVWIDEDRDGVQDGDELPLAGIIVELIDPATGEVIATTTTDASGFYEFTNLPDGEYQVQFTPDPDDPTHADLVPTFENSSDDPATDSDADREGLTGIISLDPDGTDDDPVVESSVDAGFFSDPTAVNEIGDYVWIDADQNGVQDGGELPLEGVIVELIDPATGNVIATTTTDASGFYEFVNLPDGEYVIDFALDPANPAHATLVPTWEDQGSDDGLDSDANRETGWSSVIVLDPESTDDNPVVDATVDAGFFDDPDAINEIGDYVWFDTDADGIQDIDELPVEGLIVELIDPATGVVIATTTTDATGFYEFTNLPDGEYQVKFTPDTSNPDHSGIKPTTPGVGTDGTTDSDPDPNTGLSQIIVLDPGGLDDNPVVDSTIDAGYVHPAGLGDHVWNDLDNDGEQDPGEPPIEGVVVELYGAGPDGTFGTPDDELISTTVTDPNGYYEFVDLQPDEYRIKFDLESLPEDFIPSVSCSCGGAIDTDAGSDGWTDVIVLGDGEFNPDVDFGAHLRDVDLVLFKTVIEDSITTDSVEWLLQVENIGSDPAPAQIVITDVLIDDLTYDSSRGDGWTCADDGQTVTCSHADGLAAGASSPDLIIKTTFDAAAGVVLVNAATVFSSGLGDSGEETTAETTSSNNTSNDTFTVPATPPPTLAFTGSSTQFAVLLALSLLVFGGGLVIPNLLARRVLGGRKEEEGDK